LSRGEVWGKDILEPLGKVFQKARLNVELTPELENLILPLISFGGRDGLGR